MGVVGVVPEWQNKNLLIHFVVVSEITGYGKRYRIAMHYKPCNFARSKVLGEH